jgi:hypothetical protein
LTKIEIHDIIVISKMKGRFPPMNNWKHLFNTNERQNASKDDWAEYTEISLQEFMKSDFMQDFANDCSKALEQEGREDCEDYSAIKLKMSSILEQFGYPSLRAMEDSYSEKLQLETLQEFKERYLDSK